jgi:hypothetical protein
MVVSLSHSASDRDSDGPGGLPFNSSLKFKFKLVAAQHPILRNLPNNLVHFLLDYHHPDWVAHLQLPASDGRHLQLAASAQFHSALERLEDMSEVSCPLQLFFSVNIGHRDWRGEQTVHTIPFKFYPF